jgi:hypothetical protein
MANPLLLDIALFLVANSLGTSDEVDIFRDFTPEEPDNITVLQEYGSAPLSLVDPTAHRSVQVVSRHTDSDTARTNSLAIFSALQSNQNGDGRVDLTPARWGQVYLRQSPFLLKRDNNNRTTYAFNIGITTTTE